MVESLLGLLNLKSNDSGWHGSCLSLAELARRGLLLPKRLDVVVDNVLKALVYDERRGLLLFFEGPMVVWRWLAGASRVRQDPRIRPHSGLAVTAVNENH